MIVIVCGGRGYTDRSRLFWRLDQAHAKKPITQLVEGGAWGADKLAREWAEWNGVPWLEVPADWAKHGRAAGPIRNQEMLDNAKPDAVIAFPGGKGTAHMVSIAKKAGVKVWQPEG